MSVVTRPFRHWPVAALVVFLAGCSAEAIRIVTEATDTASTVFRERKDEARIQRDHAASSRLGELSVGPNRLTVQELQPLKAAIVSAKADGTVSPDEADRILVEMERAAALRPSR